MTTMTPQQRKLEFNKLFDALPGSNADKVRAISEVLFCDRNTVRIWRMDNPPRIIPTAKLRILQRHFDKG